jgi:hypothetical protein
VFFFARRFDYLSPLSFCLDHAQRTMTTLYLPSRDLESIAGPSAIPISELRVSACFVRKQHCQHDAQHHGSYRRPPWAKRNWNQNEDWQQQPAHRRTLARGRGFVVARFCRKFHTQALLMPDARHRKLIEFVATMVETNRFHFCNFIFVDELLNFQFMVEFPCLEKVLQKSTVCDLYSGTLRKLFFVWAFCFSHGAIMPNASSIILNSR